MILVALFVTAVLGWLLLPRRFDAGLLEGMALGYALLTFGLSIEMLFVKLLGLPLPGWTLLLPWVAAAGWKLTRERPPINARPNLGHALAGVALAAVLFAWQPYERLMPLTSQTWDAWAIWLFKAKAFHLDGDLGGYLSRTGEFIGQPGYPLLTPLYAAWLYDFAGGVDDQAAKALTPGFFLALAGIFYYLVRRAATPLVAGAATAMLVLTVGLQRTAFELAGYADVPLAAYLVPAAGFLALWLKDDAPDISDLAAGSLAATAAAWTKNEGQLFLLAFVAIAAAGLILRRRRDPIAWAWLLAPPALVLGTWSAVRLAYGVEAAGFSLLADFQFRLFAIALPAMLTKAFDFSQFQLAFLLLPAAVAMGAALRAGPWFWIAPALAGVQFLGALLAYATGRNEIQWWLGTSADRILAQIVPLCLLTAALAWGLWFERSPEPASKPAAEPDPAPETRRPARKSRKRRTG